MSQNIIERILAGEFKHSLDKPKTKEELWNIIEKLIKVIEEDNKMLNELLIERNARNKTLQ